MFRHRQGFSLVELLVVVATLGILAALASLSWPGVKSYSRMSASLSNLRQIGAAIRLYAGDHDQGIPRRVTNTAGGQDKWPKLLMPYLGNPRIYAAPGDTNNYLARSADPLSNQRNNTSYILNGFNDVGAFTNETVEVRFTQVQQPSEVILVGTPHSGSTHYYMDVLEGRHGNHIDVLNLQLYGKGSTYLFADGSARFLSHEDYDYRMWLVNKDFVIP